MLIWFLMMAIGQTFAPGMVTVAQGPSSGLVDASDVVIRSQVEWEALWKSHAGPQAPPAIDFSTGLVAAVFLGTRRTGGFRVEIVEARGERDVLVIEYVERGPGPETIVTQVLTSPFHIVKVARFDGPIRFRKMEAAGRAP